MAAAVEALIHDYARRYSARDVDAVTELCLWPLSRSGRAPRFL